MSTITEIKDTINTKTLNFVLLSIVTFGVYIIMWMYKNNSSLQSITENKITSDNFIIWIAACLQISVVLDILHTLILVDPSLAGGEEVYIISNILYIAWIVLLILWSFKAKAAIQEYALNKHKIDLRMNTLFTVLFTVYYINYCINDLPEAKRKQEILSG